MKINSFISPVTGKSGVVKRDVVRVKDITDLYTKQLSTDVSRIFKDLDEVSILECIQTGYRFYYPFSVAGDALFYEQLQEVMSGGQMYYRSWGYDHQFAYERIQPESVVLDVGCGSGNFLKRIKEKAKSITGLEYNELAIAKCKEQGLEVYSESIEQHAEQRPGYYDVICLFQVLEHIYDVKSFIEASLKVLKKGGKLFIGVPNNEPFFQSYDKYSTLNLPPHHMGLWNKRSFAAIQKYFGLQLIETAFEAKGRVLVDAYLRAKLWAGVKTLIHHHTFWDKVRMMAIFPVSLMVSFVKKMTKGINGGFIIVLFEKN